MAIASTLLPAICANSNLSSKPEKRYALSVSKEIADLYKARWQIELFFRWVKQTLKIRKFLATSENAVRIQLAVALIAFLLLRISHAQTLCTSRPSTASPNQNHHRCEAAVINSDLRYAN
jgi:hypothetical protein